MTKPAYKEGFVSKQSPDGELSFKPVTHLKFAYGYSFSSARDVAFYHQFNPDDNWLPASPLRTLLFKQAYEITERGLFKFKPVFVQRRVMYSDELIELTEDVNIEAHTGDVLFRANCNIGSLRVLI